MKKRFSVGKAEWSDTREEQYRKDSLEIAFGFGDTLKTSDGTVVYIIKKDVEIVISKPNKVKTFWYETWLKLKEFYGV
ncbi:hypothetical protein QFZ77_004713 [Paenibacillus sp. V4I3]|uniref:hypothetical protein n=1 Tax=Paenibacillus sp. V4I3 TaxID=3042305 RepID=UPI002785974A|nr:hypothetical protein [Paenibacillus sp. V4I3]MDQ0876054.1 hypothetical protein [Paenibacillus sp. V4I3]